MKKYVLLIFACLMLLSLAACSSQTRQGKVLNSVGKYESEQIWTHDGFQDYTDFGIYTFSSVDLYSNPYFSAVTAENMETIGSFIDNFEEWIEACRNSNPNGDLVLNYFFDRSIVDTTDYFYIYEGENYPKYGCYDLWVFDTQTNTMYYFHNNI